MLSSLTRKIVSFLLAVIMAFLPSLSQAAMTLPLPGTVLPVSGAFTPVVIKGMVIHPEDPLKFDFLMDTGSARVTGDDLRQEAERSIKYFLASLTVPEKDLWVNLSPYEKDRIIPEEFSRTVMGRDLLGVDYVLKQMASSLLYPESDLGREFWQKVYTAAQQSGRSLADLPMDAFSRVWIMPAEAQVWENAGKVMITKSRLKVLLAKDYLSASKVTNTAQADESVAADDILRALVIPVLEKEVNEGEHFARLRQIYAGMILAAWYKERVRDSVLAQVYAGQNKVAGVEFSEGADKAAIYAQYLESAHKGVYNYIREDADIMSGDVVPRKYFSGGFQGPVPLTLIEGPEQSLSTLARLDAAQAQQLAGVLTVVSAALTALASGEVHAAGSGIASVLWHPSGLSISELVALWNGFSLPAGDAAIGAVVAAGYAFWRNGRSLGLFFSDNNDAAMVSLSAVLIAKGIALVGAAVLSGVGIARLTFAGYEYWQERKVKRLVTSLYRFDRQAAETLRDMFWMPKTTEEHLFYKASLQDWAALSRMDLKGIMMLIRFERWDELAGMTQDRATVITALKVSMKQSEGKKHYKNYNKISGLLWRLQSNEGRFQYSYNSYKFSQEDNTKSGWVKVMRAFPDKGWVKASESVPFVPVQVINDAAMLSVQQEALVAEQVKVTQFVLDGGVLTAEERLKFTQQAYALQDLRWVPGRYEKTERLAYFYGLLNWEALETIGEQAIPILAAENHAWDIIKMMKGFLPGKQDELAESIRVLMKSAENRGYYKLHNTYAAVLNQLSIYGGENQYVQKDGEWQKVPRIRVYDTRDNDKTIDASQLGGVNLNPQELNLEIQGQGAGFSRPFSGDSVGRDSIKGYAPVIYHIAPMVPQPTAISD